MADIYYGLSADGVEELAPYLEAADIKIPDYMDSYLRQIIPNKYESAGIRGFNYSMWRANLVAVTYSQGG